MDKKIKELKTVEREQEYEYEREHECEREREQKRLEIAWEKWSKQNDLWLKEWEYIFDE